MAGRGHQKRQDRFFLEGRFVPRTDHGGALRPGRRKLARPIDPRRGMHVVFRSSKARGELSLLHPKHSAKVQRLIHGVAARYDIRVYRFANTGRHLHLIVKAKSRVSFQNFLRLLAGKIAQEVTGARKGLAFGRFWDALAFTRVIKWGRVYSILQGHLGFTEIESEGIFDRARQLAKLLAERAQSPPNGGSDDQAGHLAPLG